MGRGRSGAGSAVARKIIAELKKAEDSIRNNSYETAIAIGKNGERVYDKSDGHQSQVQIEIKPEMQDCIFTHNHPRGTTFSEEDINAAFTVGMREIRACHETGYYSLRRLFNLGDSIPAMYQDFATDYAEAVRRVKNVTDRKWAAGPQTYELAERLNREIADYRREWLSKHAKAYGWEYSEGTVHRREA